MDHLAALKRLAASSRSWARDAVQPGSPMLFVSAAGFEDSFHAVARDLGHSLLTWTAEDLF